MWRSFLYADGRQNGEIMSDETNAQAVAEQKPDTPTAGEQQQEQPAHAPERTFTQADVDRLIGERIAKTHEGEQLATKSQRRSQA